MNKEEWKMVKMKQGNKIWSKKNGKRLQYMYGWNKLKMGGNEKLRNEYKEKEKKIGNRNK